MIESSGGSRIFAMWVRQLVPLECPKPLHVLSLSDPSENFVGASCKVKIIIVLSAVLTIFEIGRP